MSSLLKRRHQKFEIMLQHILSYIEDHTVVSWLILSRPNLRSAMINQNPGWYRTPKACLR